MSWAEALEKEFEVYQRFGSEYVIECPHPDHADTHPSCWANTEKGLWVCYSCGAGGRVEDILKGRFTEPTVTMEELDRALELMYEKRTQDCFPEAWLDRYTIHPQGKEFWHNERGYSHAIIDTFKLGYDPVSSCATYPVRDTFGRVLGVVRRRLDGGKPKYKYPKGVAMHDYLWGYDSYVRTDERRVAITEGVPDALALWDAGVPAVGQYGSRLSDRQAELLRAADPLEVVLAFDNDEVGRTAVERAVEAIDFTLVRVVDWSGRSEKDIDEVPLSQRRAMIEEALDPLDQLV